MRTEFSKKNVLKNKEMDFKNGVKNIQVAAYNGARTVYYIPISHQFPFPQFLDHSNPLTLKIVTSLMEVP